MDRYYTDLSRSTEPLEELLRIAEETKNIGCGINMELLRQRERLQDISSNVIVIDNSINKAEQLIKNIEKKWYDPRTWF
jgi:hypothetical protein